jgi:uncharacterized protein (DUF1697 family)
MDVLISMLRGINVSGQKRVPMSELKKVYADLNFCNITTYINSGNVVFSSSISDPKELSEKIERLIFEKFGFKVPVTIRTAEEMLSVIKNNPFLEESSIEIEKLHVTFLSGVPDNDGIIKIMEYDYKPDRFIIKHKEVFLYCPDGYGNTKFTNSFFENKLKLKATTRNWKTVNELAAIASAN